MADERPTQFGRQEHIDQLGQEELKVWGVYQDFLACIDMTIVDPPTAGSIAAMLASTVINGVGLANLQPGNKP